MLVDVREAASTEGLDAVCSELTFRVDSSSVPVTAPPKES